MFFIFSQFNNKLNHHQVKLNLTFEAPKGINPSLEELNLFFEAISKLHEYALYTSQPEYFNSSVVTRGLKILPNHELKVDRLCRENPFEMIMIFHIVREGIPAYLPLLKILIILCERYGADANTLYQNLIETRQFFEKLYIKFVRNAGNSIFLDELNIYEDSDKLYSKMISKLNKLLTDKEFRKYYDFFCKTSFTITKFSTSIEGIEDVAEFIS
ncbi:MAG: hypothetical protein RLZZ118_1240 [Bacteroidota bacterium]